MTNSFRFSLLLSYIIFNCISDIRTVPKGYLLGATYELGPTSNKLYKIDPLTGEFTLLTLLDYYNPGDVTYDLVNKIFYVLASGTLIRQESSRLLILVNPFNGTKQYRTIITEDAAELFGLRVDSSTGKLYSLQMTGGEENPISIAQIDPINYIAKRWVNITKFDAVVPASMTIFYNLTHHQYFVTVATDVYDHTLVGIDLIKRKIISQVPDYDFLSCLCYDNKTNAFYGMQGFIDKLGCRLVRLNPYNGTTDILSEDFNNYYASAGDCYDGYYFTIIVLNSETRKILTFDLNNNGKLISNQTTKERLSELAFIPT